MARGTYRDPVVHRMTYKSFAASKNFYREALDTDEAVDAWLKKFSEELWERVTKDREKHNRAPTNVTISVNRGGSGYNFPRDARVSRRNHNAPDYRLFNLGFRLFRTIP